MGEKQFEILFGKETTQHNLLYSAEGAGKTVLMAMWVWVQIFAAATAGVGGAIGATAPTTPRLGTLIKAVTDLAPISTSRTPMKGAWGTLYVDAQEVTTVSGHTIQFRSTKRQSGATGSPVQGFSWFCAAMDEAQDQVEQGAYEDVVARLRAAPNAPIMATATAKDSPTWRNWRDALSDNWTIHRLSYQDTPFVHDSHWAMMKAECSEREWKRRGLALDVGPELGTYPSWERSENIRTIPQIGAKDVTAKVLGRFGSNFEMLAGHDPGSLQDVTVLLKAYQLPREKSHVWFVVDEFRTQMDTSEAHAHGLRNHLQQKWGIQYADHDEPKCLLRCDPYGTTDNRTHRSVYTIFKLAGFDIRSAAFRKGKGNGVIPKEAGIEMVNSLLCNANGERRLFVACDERTRPSAPLLVESLELSERDAAGKAETQKKRTKGPGGDLSDFPAALRYALWQVERVRPQTPTQGAVVF